MKTETKKENLREWCSSIVLLALIGICWYFLNDRIIDTSSISFVYKDF